MSTRGMRIWSWRWWFEDRATGRITIAQFPNPPLFGIAAAWLVRRMTDEGSTLYDVAGVALTGLWIFWAADEMLRGVNPWRRVLGASVVVWQVARLL